MHQLGEEEPGRRVGRRTPVDGQLHIASRHVGQREMTCGVGEDRLVLMPEHEHFYARDRQFPCVVGKIGAAARRAADVVGRQRRIVGARVDDDAGDRRARHERGARCRERIQHLGAGGREAAGVERRAIGGFDLGSVDVDRELRCARKRPLRQEPSAATAIEGDDDRRHHGTGRIGDVEAGAGQGGRVGSAGEHDLRPIRHTDVGRIRGRCQGSDHKWDGGRHRQAERVRGRVARRIRCGQHERVRPDPRGEQVNHRPKAASHRVERNGMRNAVIERVGQGR